MDMSGMGMGMEMGSGSSGLFLADNQLLARTYWYAIATAVACFTIIRVVSKYQVWRCLRSYRTDPHGTPSRPVSYLALFYATMTAICRESTYPQPLSFSGSISRYFTPLPLGHWLLLVVYWIFLITCLWSNVILTPDDDMYPYRWEKVGFRAAWISVTQVPFIYLLSAKLNPITFLTGISYERFNWLHRWAARTLFLTVIVHWSFFYTEWAMADFVQTELQTMTVVKYGFGAWAVLGWMVLSSFGYLRAKAYEFFVLQHLAAAAALLWLLYKHVPEYARYNIWISTAFVAFDWSFRFIWNISRNLHVFGGLTTRLVGYHATLESLPGDMIRMTVEGVDFSWKAGQHAYVSLPWLRPFELHPFTIANIPETPESPDSGRNLTFVIKPHSGFSRSLHKAASKSQSSGKKRRVLLSGPWGKPPDLKHCESIILIATSTGASFTIPIFEKLIKSPGCVREISFHWIVSQAEHFQVFGETLTSTVQRAQQSRLSVKVVVHVTRHGMYGAVSNQSKHSDSTEKAKEIATPSVEPSILEQGTRKMTSVSIHEESSSSSTHSSAPNSPQEDIVMKYGARPTVESMIRGPVEAATGETGIVVCGGTSITAQARTFVAALSDQRAVHKGTGAQGIFLFTESYGW